MELVIVEPPVRIEETPPVKRGLWYPQWHLFLLRWREVCRLLHLAMILDIVGGVGAGEPQVRRSHRGAH
jgi:hypothetical protein